MEKSTTNDHRWIPLLRALTRGTWRRSRFPTLVRSLGDGYLRGQLAKDISWLYLLHFLNYLVPMLMIPYLARVLGAKGWGGLAFALSYAGFVATITEYGFYVSAQREAARHKQDKEALSKLFNEVLCAKLLIACVIAVASLAGSGFIPILKEARRLLIGALFLGITQALSLTWYFRGIQRIRLAAGMEGAAKGLGAILVISLVRSPADSWKYLYAFGASQLFVLVWGFLRASGDIRLGTRAVLSGKRALRNGGPLFLLHIIGSIFSTGNVLVLGSLAPVEVVGYYAGSEKIVRFLANVMEPVRHAMFPRLSELAQICRQKARDQVKRALVVMGLISIIMGCFVYLLAPRLVAWILGNDFSSAIDCLRVLALWVPLLTLNAGLGFLWMLPRGFERTCLVIISTALVMNLTLALLLVSTWRDVGMAISVLTSELFVVVSFWIIFVRDNGEQRVAGPPTIDDYLRAPAHPLRRIGGRRWAAKRGDDPKLPLVTVLTVVRNRKRTLRQTIMSVLNQSYPNIEYIVVDGTSTDGTLEVINQFDNEIDLWISEPDLGPADAVNKAISVARGDVIFWLSSDDWIDPDFIEIGVQSLLSSDADFVFGDVTIYKNEAPDFILKGDKNYAQSITFRKPRLNFQSMLIRKECFEKVGLLDVAFAVGCDYEWSLRLHVHGGIGTYESRLNVFHRAGGMAEKRYLRNMIEELKALRRHGIPVARSFATNLYYLVRRLGRIFAKLFLPDITYKKLMRFARRKYSVPLK